MGFLEHGKIYIQDHLGPSMRKDRGKIIKQKLGKHILEHLKVSLCGGGICGVTVGG